MAKFGFIIIEATDKQSGNVIRREVVSTLECPTLKAAHEMFVPKWYAEYATEIAERLQCISEGYALASARRDIRIAARFGDTVTGVGISRTDGRVIAIAAKATAKVKHDRRKAYKAAKAKAKKSGNAKAKALANGIDTAVRTSKVDNVA